MRRIIYSVKKSVDGLCTFTGDYSAHIWGYIYINQNKYLWWKGKPFLSIKVEVPYVEDPVYNGERCSNIKLSIYEKEMVNVLKLKADKIQRRIDRILKSKKK